MANATRAPVGCQHVWVAAGTAAAAAAAALWGQPTAEGTPAALLRTAQTRQASRGYSQSEQRSQGSSAARAAAEAVVCGGACPLLRRFGLRTACQQQPGQQHNSHLSGRWQEQSTGADAGAGPGGRYGEGLRSDPSEEPEARRPTGYCGCPAPSAAPCPHPPLSQRF